MKEKRRTSKFSLFYGSEIPQKLGIEEIPAGEVRISPELLKK